MLAIKQVPVDTDLQEIIKEISIMQQCDSLYVVKYYGSYFKNTDLWVRTGRPAAGLAFRRGCRVATGLSTGPLRGAGWGGQREHRQATGQVGQSDDHFANEACSAEESTAATAARVVWQQRGNIRMGFVLRYIFRL